MITNSTLVVFILIGIVVVILLACAVRKSKNTMTPEERAYWLKHVDFVDATYGKGILPETNEDER